MSIEDTSVKLNALQDAEQDKPQGCQAVEDALAVSTITNKILRLIKQLDENRQQMAVKSLRVLLNSLDANNI